MSTLIEGEVLTGGPSVGPDDLDPVLLQLGLLVGLLGPRGGDGRHPIDESWFSNPLAALQAIPSHRAAELVKLFEALLESSSGSALGVPVQSEQRSWYPLLPPDGGVESPFYFVAPQALEETDVVVGLGVRHAFALDGVTVTAFAYLPILQMGSNVGAPKFVLGSDVQPAQVGLEVHGLGLGADGVSFDGLQFAAEIYLQEVPAVDLVFLKLALPGRPAQDTSLADLKALPASEWVATALSLIVGQLVSALPEQEQKTVENALQDVLLLLGLEGGLPSIDWAALVKGEQQAQAAFLDWVGTIAGSPVNLRGWLLALYCLFQGITPPPDKSDPTGNDKRAGTRDDPFLLPLVQIADVALGLTIATEIDESKTLHVYPGVSFETMPIAPVSAVPSLGVVVAASAELVAIPIPAPSQHGELRTLDAAILGDILFPSLHASVSVRNPTAGKPLFATGDTAGGKPGTFSIDSVHVGLAVKGGYAPVPDFTLVKVVTAAGSWPAIDLANFDTKIDLGTLLTEAIQAAIETFLGVGTQASADANAVAALLGVTPPPAYKDDWPVTEMLLAEGGLDQLVAHPVTALGAYYTRALAAKTPDGQAAWAHLLPELSVLLGQATPQLTGTGARDDPWGAVVATLAGGVQIQVRAWAAGPREVQLGLAFVLPVKFSEATLELSLAVDLLDLALPDADGSGSYGAGWLPEVAAEARVLPPGGSGTLKTAPLGGLTIEVDDIAVTGGWRRVGGVYAAAEIVNANIHDGAGTTFPVGTLDFVFTPSSWDPGQLAKLAQAAVYLAGAFLLENGGRFGVALTTALGLLPNLPQLYAGASDGKYPFPMPSGFELPAGWPSMTVDGATFFSAPWTPAVAQLDALVTHADMAEATMQLLGWAVTGTLPQAPSPAPAGTSADPYSVLLPNVLDLQVLVWTETDTGQKAPSRLGLGVRRTMSKQALSTLELDASVRADLARVTLPTGRVLALAGVDAPKADVPRLVLECSFANPTAGAPLVTGPGGLQIGSVVLGGEVTESGFWPIALLEDATPSSKTPAVTLDIAAALASSDGMQLFGQLLDAFMQFVSAQVPAAEAETTPLAAALELLEAVGLVTKTARGDCGVSLLPWMSLVADPQKYATTQVDAIFSDQDRFDEVMDALAVLLGRAELTIPPSLAALPPVLGALGLMTKTPAGYRPTLAAWVALADDPVGYLEAAGKRLFADAALRQALVTELSALPAPSGRKLPWGMTLTVQGGTRVELAVPTSPGIPIGSEIAAAGSVVLDVKALSLTVGTIVWSELAGSALAVQLGVQADTNLDVTPSWEIDLAAAPSGDAPAAFAPIPLYAKPAKGNQQALAVAVPLFVLSTAATALLNGFVLPHSPLTVRVFQALGLTRAPSSDQVGSLMAVLMHPIDWVLSPAVLGDGKGGIDLAGAGKLLAAIPGPDGVDGPGATKLTATDSNGLALSGLPYGGRLSLAATATDGLTAGVGVKDTVDGTTLDVAAAISYGLGSGVHLTGSAELDVTVASGAAVDLKAAFGKAGFTLQLSGTASGKRFPAGDAWVDLVPFGGLNQYIGEAAEALLEVVASKAWAAYEAWTGKPPALVQFVSGVQTAAAAVEITDVPSLVQAAEDIDSDALKWLRQWGEPSKAQQVVTAVHTLLTGPLGLTEFKLDGTGKMISYAPPIPEKYGALTITSGMQQDAWGVWLAPEFAYTVPNGPRLFVELDTGVAMKSGQVAFTLDAGMGLDLAALGVPALSGGPELRAAVGGGTGAWTWSLALYPAGYGETSTTLVVALLPAPLLAWGSAPQTAVAAGPWLKQLGLGFALPLIADVLLATKQVGAWLDTPPFKDHAQATAGKVLADFGVLARKGKSPYELTDVVKLFTSSTPIELLERLLYAALDTFQGVTVVPLLEGGISIVAEKDGTNTDYGVKLTLPDVSLTSNPSSSPQVVLQLGSKGSNGPATGGIGITALRASADTPPALSFAPGVELESVGVDVLGASKKPLVDLSGFTLGGVGPRLTLDLALSNGGVHATKYGASIELESIGVPLGPKLGSGGGGSNPIAQNLVSSSGSGADAVNPAFSVEAAYDSQTGFSVEFLDGKGDAKNQVWIPIQRALGPLYCRKIGIGWETSGYLLDLGFDGSVALAGLGLDVENLMVKIPVKTPLAFESYGLGLDGLELSFKGGPVAMTGGLLKSTDPDTGIVDYDGMLALHAGTWGLTALGGYSKIKNPSGGYFEPSLFAFAMVNAPIGGPPYFFVTGVAAGFGYNRGLILPDQDHVAEFPLVAGVVSPSKTFPDPNNLSAVFKTLHDDIPPSPGTYWLAAGIAFTTFEMLQSFALLTVEFGAKFEVGLLGVCTLAIPTNVGGARPLAQATMQLEVLIEPDEGVVSATATLTPDSFVLDPAAQLTGGFALDVWFGKSPHAGDFVVTLGGYHPSFVPPPHGQRPDYYPDVPRLGINWPMGDVQLKGGVYFALTPSCVMAGGSLSLTYSSGNLSAWFDAYADFLARWRPFYFEADIGVSIGASYRVDLLFIHHTFTIELSASVSMHGTPVGGRAHVSWYIISFTVPFGDDAEPAGLKDWGDFDQAFLPKPQPSEAVAAVAAAGTDSGQVLSAAVDVGLLGHTDGDPDNWIVNPRKFRFVTTSLIPSNAATLNDDPAPIAGATTALGVRPLGWTSVTNTHKITFQRKVNGAWQDVDTEWLSLTPVLQGAPDALWSTVPQPNGPSQPSADVVKNTVSGFTIDSTEGLIDPHGPFKIESRPDQLQFPWPAIAQPTRRYPQTDQVGQMKASLQDGGVTTARDALVAALQRSNPTLEPGEGLPVMAKFAERILQAQPNIVPLGGQLTGTGAL
jgi:hypothetical protein